MVVDMETNIKQALSDLAPLALELDDIDNLISKKILAIEEAIRKRVSVRIQIDVPPSGNLAFGKRDASFDVELPTPLARVRDGVRTPLDATKVL